MNELGEPGDAPEVGSVIAGLPVFPLPNVVFFPHMMLPLHVFEPRYRDLLRHVVAGDRRLGVALLRPGWEPDYYGAPRIHDMFCVGEVVGHEELADGRSNLLLRGLARVRVLEEEHTGLPFRTMRVRVEGAPPVGSGRDLLARHLATVRQLFSSRGGAISRMGADDMDLLFSSELPPEIVLDAIAAANPAPSPRKQEVLEETNLLRRAELVASLLADLLSIAPGDVADES